MNPYCDMDFQVVLLFNCSLYISIIIFNTSFMKDYIVGSYGASIKAFSKQMTHMENALIKSKINQETTFEALRLIPKTSIYSSFDIFFPLKFALSLSVSKTLSPASIVLLSFFCSFCVYRVSLYICTKYNLYVP